MVGGVTVLVETAEATKCSRFRCSLYKCIYDIWNIVLWRYFRAKDIPHARRRRCLTSSEKSSKGGMVAKSLISLKPLVRFPLKLNSFQRQYWRMSWTFFKEIELKIFSEKGFKWKFGPISRYLFWDPIGLILKEKRKRSDSVLWQKPLHQQKCQKGKVTTQTTPQKVRLNSGCGPT